MSRTTKVLTSISFILSLILIYACLRSAYVTSFFPIYTDEIAERFILSRIVYDFPIKFALLPMCKYITNHYPGIWYFPGFVEWLIHGQIQNLKVFRLIGILTGWLFFLVLTLQLCLPPSTSPNTPRSGVVFICIALGAVLSLSEIGVVPFSLVTVRPEQCILVLLASLLVLFSIPVKTNRMRFTIISGYFLFLSLLLYMHPKTLFLIPALFVIALQLFSHLKNRYWVMFFICLFFGIVLLNYHAWIETFVNCRNPHISKLFSSFNIDLKNIVKNPSVFWSEIWENISNSTIEVDRIRFQVDPEVNYIPAIEIGKNLNYFNYIIFVNYTAILVSLSVFSLFSYAKDLLKKRIITRNLLTIILLLCFIANMLINKTKHWYDATYLWSSLVVIFIFYISDKIPAFSKQKTFHVVLWYFLSTGIVSQYFFISRYEPAFIAGFTGPGIPLYNYNHKLIRRDLYALSSLCHIKINESKHLILDDLTYSYFQKSQYPLAYTYLFLGDDKAFLHSFWEKYKIDGLIVRAEYLPQALRNKYAVQLGAFACVEKKNIKPMFREMQGI